MKAKKTLATWIRWYHESQEQLATTEEFVPMIGTDGSDEIVTVVVPDGSPQTDLQNDLIALSGVRWVFEWTVVPGPETMQ